MGLLGLLVESLLMTVATYSCALCPLMLAGERGHRSILGLDIDAVSTLSVGMLVSTAFSIVLPEGIAVLLRSLSARSVDEQDGGVHEHLDDSADHQSGLAGYVGIALCAGFVLMYCIHEFTSDPVTPTRRKSRQTQGHGALTEATLLHNTHETINDEEADYTDENGSEYFAVASASSKRVTAHHGRRPSEAFSPLSPASATFPIFIGLVCHALADGIALGAATAASSIPDSKTPGDATDASGSSLGLSLTVFLALLIHKAPVAFSLSSLLLSYMPNTNMKAHKASLRRALAVFSLSTPVGAGATWLLLKLVTYLSWNTSLEDSFEDDSESSTLPASSPASRLDFWTGMALLFSAGTFLFVSTHIMNDSNKHSHGDSSSDISLSDETCTAAGKSGRRARMLLFISGMAIPLVLSHLMAGHHGH